MYRNGTTTATATALQWTPAETPTTETPPCFREGVFDGVDVDLLIEELTGCSTMPPQDVMDAMPPHVVQWICSCIEAALLTGYRIGRNPDLLLLAK